MKRTLANLLLAGLALVCGQALAPDAGALADQHGLAGGRAHSGAAAAGVLDDGEVIVEDFNGPSPLVHWNVGGGPATTRALSLTSGHTGVGAHFVFNLASAAPDQAYVWANRPLDAPLNAPAVAFWVRSPAGICVKLQVTDSTGQTLQYPLVRPFGVTNAATWYRHVVRLDPTPEHWGGANDGVLHGPIQALTILAADLPGAHSAGALDFDDLALIDAPAVRLNPYIQAAFLPPPGSADLAARLGVNIHFPQSPDYVVDERALNAIQSAGFTWVRQDLPWAAIETHAGVYDFGPWDALVSQLEARGLKALFILDQGNPLYTESWQIPATTPAAIQAFGAYAEAAAQHFAGRPVQFEVWNEPNLDNFWPPAANAGQYVALAQEAIAHIHLGNPSAEASTGGLSGFDFPFLRSILSAGAVGAADAVGVHPYGAPRPESVSDSTLLMRSIVGQMIPANPPVWDTEWGYTSAAFGNGHSSEARMRQAVLAARALLSAWAVGYPLMIYYDIRDDGVDAYDYEHNFGLLANDYAEKPAMQAVRALTAAAEGRTLGGFIDIQPTSLHALRLNGPKDMLVALWSDAPGGQVQVLLPPLTTGVNYLGAPLALAPAGGGLALTVRESDGPVYLTCARQNLVFLPLVQK